MNNSVINLLDLPDLVLIRILENLSAVPIINVRLTCTKLYRLTFTKEILKKQKFIFNEDFRKREGKLLHLFNELDGCGFNLHFCYYVPKEEMFNLFIRQHGHRINSLIFESISVTFNMIRHVIWFCRELKEWNIWGCEYFDCCKSSDRFIEKRENLEVLELRGSSLVDYHIDVLLENFPCIKTFVYDLDCCSSSIVAKRFYRQGFNEGSRDLLCIHFMLNKIYNYNKLIHTLCISVDEVIGSIGKKEIEDLSSSTLNLQGLYLYGHDAIPISAFEYLFSKQTNLKLLDVRGCIFNIKCLEVLLNNCLKLEKLYVDGSDELSFEDIMEKIHKYGHCLKALLNTKTKFSLNKNPEFHILQFPLLRTIHVSHFDVGPMEIYRSLTILRTCNLTFLSLVEVKIFQDPGVLLEIISASQNTLVNLKVICLVDYTVPQEHGLVPKMYFPKLKSLQLNVRNKSHFEQNCSESEIYENNEVVDRILGDLNFPNLTELSLLMPFNIEKYYKMLLKGCSILEYLAFVSHIFENHKGVMEKLLDHFKPLRGFKIERMNMLSRFMTTLHEDISDQKWLFFINPNSEPLHDYACRVLCTNRTAKESLFICEMKSRIS